MPKSLYVHFPFCRRKCSYCALYSCVGISQSERDAYVRQLVPAARGRYDSVYFGGGSPALCDLRPLLDAVSAEEFTVELHPLDVTDDLLRDLKAGGVNRISLGVQSVEDEILAEMGRGYTFEEAERAFACVKRHFDNAGIDLIVGYPHESGALLPRHARLANWGLRHCSVYALQNERGLKNVADDETTMNRIGIMASFLADLGFRRYEISNYAIPSFECHYNQAVWRGEDYLGLGAGACGRVGLKRTRNEGLSPAGWHGQKPAHEIVDATFDEKERRFFRLRTREGLDTHGHPEWQTALDHFIPEGLLTRSGEVYYLTPRGTEVCDAILAEIA